MKANELRIGNYLFDENSNVKQVVKIGFTRVWIGKVDEYWEAVDYNETSSIPLTEEWLLKFGFEWKGLGGKFLTIFTPCGKALVYIGDDFFRFTNVTIETPIKCVHQLQNLYFALTGEELILTKNETN